MSTPTTVDIVFTHPMTHFRTALDPQPDRKAYRRGDRLTVTWTEAEALCDGPHRTAEYAEVVRAKEDAQVFIREADAKMRDFLERARRRAKGEDVPEPLETVTVTVDTASLQAELDAAHAALADAQTELQAKQEMIEVLQGELDAANAALAKTKK